MKYIIDIDGTICKEVIIPDSGGKKDYANSFIWIPIAKVNKLYDAGHTIKYMTAPTVLVVELTTELSSEEQLAKWGAKYHELDVGNKPYYDTPWIDDKAFWSENSRRNWRDI